MKKNEFLNELKSSFIASFPSWDLVYADKKSYLCVIGKYINETCIVFACFGVRPDNYNFGSSVGWSTNKETLIKMFTVKENPPTRLRDGSLKRLKEIEHPRDFTYNEMIIPVFSLYKPFGGIHLDKTDKNETIDNAITEFRHYGCEYLALMLKHKYHLNINSSEI